MFGACVKLTVCLAGQRTNLPMQVLWHTPRFVEQIHILKCCCRFEALHLRVWILGGAQEEISGFEAQILTDSADQVCILAAVRVCARVHAST